MNSIKNQIISPAIIFLLLWTVYLATLAPSISPDDAGELITAAYTQGIAHPPGYSLYTLVTSGSLKIPLGRIAYRANLGSAFWIALASVVVYFILRRFFISGSLIITGAVIMGLLPTTWRQAVLSEVYALNLVLALLTLYFIISSKSKRGTCLVVFFWGLSLLSHYQNLFLLPFVALRVIPHRRRFTSLMLILGLAGMLLLYFPIRAVKWPNLNWGVTSNLPRLVNHLTRSQYHEIRQPHTLLKTIEQWRYFLKLQVSEFTYVLLILVLPGIFFLFRRSKRQLGLLLTLYLVFFISTSHFLNYQNFIRASYLGPKFLLLNSALLIILLTAGLAFFNGFAALRRFMALSLCIPLFFAIRNYQTRDFSRYFVARDYTQNMLAQVKKNGTVFLNEDYEIFPLIYAGLVEGKRADVAVFDFNDEPFQSIFENLDPKRIYDISYNYPKLDISLKRGKPLYLTVRPREIRSKLYLDGFFYTNQTQDTRLDKIPFRYQAAYNDYANRCLAARYYLVKGMANAPGSSGTRYQYLKKSSELVYDQSAVKRQIAKAYQKLGQYQKAQSEFRGVIKLEKQGL